MMSQKKARTGCSAQPAAAVSRLPAHLIVLKVKAHGHNFIQVIIAEEVVDGRLAADVLQGHHRSICTRAYQAWDFSEVVVHHAGRSLDCRMA